MQVTSRAYSPPLVFTNTYSPEVPAGSLMLSSPAAQRGLCRHPCAADEPDVLSPITSQQVPFCGLACCLIAAGQASPEGSGVGGKEPIRDSGKCHAIGVAAAGKRWGPPEHLRCSETAGESSHLQVLPTAQSKILGKRLKSEPCAWMAALAIHLSSQST